MGVISEETSPQSTDTCPECYSQDTVILRKEPQVRGHKILRKCSKCETSWEYNTEFGTGAWRY